MASTCPHCGFPLPITADVFCPECRNAIDEIPAAPAPPATPHEQRVVREAHTATAFGVLGLVGLAGAVLAALRKSWLDATWSIALCSLGGVAMLTEAARRSARARRLKQQQESAEKGGNA
jgi:hypothetical protein